MQIIADVSKIWKTVPGDLIFILDVLPESRNHFFQFSIVLAKRNAVSFTAFLLRERVRAFAATI